MTLNSQSNEFFFKVVLIGAPSVGKTSILEQFVTQQFTPDYKATIGADFRTKEIQISGQKVLLQIWDTAGQERFRALAAPFYRGANICVLVFDISQKLTFDAIEQWRDEFLHHADVEDQDQFPFLLLGNKCDLGEKITTNDVNNWMNNRGFSNMVYMQTSAKNNINIKQAFDQVAKSCLMAYANTSLYVMHETNQTDIDTVGDSIVDDDDDEQNIDLERISQREQQNNNNNNINNNDNNKNSTCNYCNIL